MLHQDGNNDVDEHKLGHEHEDHEVDGGDDGADAAVGHAVVRIVAVLSQRVLHDSVPVVARGDAEEREEGHAEVFEVGVPPEADTGEVHGAFCSEKTGNSGWEMAVFTNVHVYM